MRLRMPCRSMLFAVLAMVLSIASRARAAQGSFDRNLKVTGAVELEVHTGSGNISVRPGSASNISVHGDIKASNSWTDKGSAEEKVRRLESNPPIEQNGNAIRIGHIEDPDLRRNVSISYEIVVPVQTQLRCDTGSGEITIEGIHGPVKGSTGSGHLRL